jgi:ferredoxin-NADP reductase
VWVKLPYGEFTINPETDVCLLAGGTGITAFTSFLASIQADYPHKIHLFYGTRRSELLVYRSLATSAAQRCPNLQALFFAEQLDVNADCLSGRIDLEIVWNKLLDPLATKYYLAGPPEMLLALSQGLNHQGVISNCILIDAWE